MKRRHPFRGLFFGLLLGLGLAMLLITFGVVPIGLLTPWVALVVGLLLGVLIGLFGPARGHPPSPIMARAGPTPPTADDRIPPAAA